VLSQPGARTDWSVFYKDRLIANWKSHELLLARDYGSNHDVLAARCNPLYDKWVKIRDLSAMASREPKGPKSTNLGSNFYKDIRESIEKCFLVT